MSKTTASAAGGAMPNAELVTLAKEMIRTFRAHGHDVHVRGGAAGILLHVGAQTVPDEAAPEGCRHLLGFDGARYVDLWRRPDVSAILAAALEGAGQ